VQSGFFLNTNKPRGLRVKVYRFMTLNLIGAIAAICLYILAAVLINKGRIAAGVLQPKNLLWIAGAAALFHGLTLFNIIFTPRGKNMSTFYALSIIGWLAALLFISASFTKPVERLGIVILPLAALMLCLQILFPGDHIIAPVGIWQLQTHILFSLFAISMLYLAAVQAVLLYVQDSQLHAKHLGKFVRRLPPLQIMEDLLFQIIVVGFLLLSIALITGVIFIEDLFAKGHAHKTVLSILAWILFATLLFGRHQFGWRGRTAISWTLGGFASLILAYIGTKIVLEIILNR
jgi:ABC-type uncharacterized transport system permease subunit